ncbi:ABC transporter [Streptomyces smaragdinus]|uniref:ABC transporter n=1 Tax=Streptomyces smaragdinus TaxID=2585196 RepID=UPI002B1EF3EB|nr:ABC transporter [Streptomyces smaragdinus]
MTALVRYQCALLVRGHRWLAPAVLYAAILAIGIRGGEPALDSLGFAAAALTPSAAWLVRICVGAEPDAARACTVAARGAARTHLAALLAALAGALTLALAGTGAVLAVSDPRSSDHEVRLDVLPTAAAGLTAAVSCALLGVAVGALANRPVLRGPARSVPATLIGALAVLVAGVSPANAAVTGLVTGSRHGTVDLPLGPLALAAAVTAAAAAAACAVSGRRG